MPIRRTPILALLAVVGTGCSDGGESRDPSAPSSSATTASVAGTGGSGGIGPGAGGAGGAGGVGGAGGPRRVTIFHTSDEHGWLLPDEVSVPSWVLGGAANFRGWLAEKEGFVPGEHLLVSSGDNWTGPAISTWYEGEPVVEVMNLLGYSASAIGNHEFDFDRDILAKRVAEASFPYLGANIVDDATGTIPRFALPHVIVPANGVNVGIIGLTTTSTYTTAHPKFVVGLSFENLRTTLLAEVPLVRAAGADMVFVLAHECAEILTPATKGLAAKGAKIDAVFAGHCHDAKLEDVDGVPMVSSGEHWNDYARLDVDFDPATGQTTVADLKLEKVRYPSGGANVVTPDPAIEAVVDVWKTKVDQELGEPVGYTATGFPLASWKMANWVVDAWLAEFPQADVAINNFGGLREAIGSGDFTLANVVGMLPFKNQLYLVELTGAQIQANLAWGLGCGVQGACYPSVGGMTFHDDGGGMVSVTLAGGAVFDPSATYNVLVPDFLYYGGSGFDIQSHDPTPIDLGVHMRDPVVSWTQALMTSAADPVDDHVDSAPRNQ